MALIFLILSDFKYGALYSSETGLKLCHTSIMQLLWQVALTVFPVDPKYPASEPASTLPAG